MKRLFILFLIILTFLVPPPLFAASYGIEINLLRTLDMLLALPFKLINAILGEEPPLEPVSDDSKATPVMI